MMAAFYRLLICCVRAAIKCVNRFILI
jgi:hypothetical protein